MANKIYKQCLKFKSKYPSAVGAIILLEMCSVPGNTGTIELEMSVLFFIDKLLIDMFQLAIVSDVLPSADVKYFA